MTACTRSDGAIDGPAEERLSMTSTTRSGRYANGRRVGVWTQRSETTGVEVGSFTLDESGSGVEVVRDLEGHVRRGSVLNGRRERIWTHHARDGHVVASDQWARPPARRLASTGP